MTESPENREKQSIRYSVWLCSPDTHTPERLCQLKERTPTEDIWESVILTEPIGDNELLEVPLRGSKAYYRSYSSYPPDRNPKEKMVKRLKANFPNENPDTAIFVDHVSPKNMELLVSHGWKIVSASQSSKTT